MAFPATDLTQIIAGEFVDENDWNELVDALNFLADPPTCHVRHNATQSLTSGVATVLAWNTEVYDSASMHDTVTNNSRIVFPVAGVYDIKATLALAADNDYHDVLVFPRVNGAARLAASTHWSDGTLFLNVATDYKAAALEYVEIVAFQANTSAAANNVLAYNSASAPIGFSVRWSGRG